MLGLFCVVQQAPHPWCRVLAFIVFTLCIQASNQIQEVGSHHCQLIPYVNLACPHVLILARHLESRHAAGVSG